MFSAIGGVLGNMFGTQKAGEALITGAMNGIDKLFYTDEEKAIDGAKAKTEAMAVYMKWLDSTSGSRLARRMIATTVVGIWALEHLASVILGTISVWASADVVVDAGVMLPNKFAEASQMLAQQATENNSLVGVVLLFYFGGPAAIDGVKGLVMKWSNKGSK